MLSCKLSRRLFRSERLEWIVVSSANSSHKAFMNKGKSFMLREKRSGPNTCGILYFTGRKSDLIVFI